MRKPWLDHRLVLPTVQLPFSVDMIADAHLDIPRESHSTPWLTHIGFTQARQLGYRRYFLHRPRVCRRRSPPFRQTRDSSRRHHRPRLSTLQPLLAHPASIPSTSAAQGVLPSSEIPRSEAYRRLRRCHGPGWSALQSSTRLLAWTFLPSPSRRATRTRFNRDPRASKLHPLRQGPLSATPRPNRPTRFRAFSPCPSCEPTSCDFGPPLFPVSLCSRAPQAGERPCALAVTAPFCLRSAALRVSVPPEKTRLEGPALNAVFSGSSAKSRSLTWGAGATCLEVPREQARQEKEYFKLCTSIAYH